MICAHCELLAYITAFPEIDYKVILISNVIRKGEGY